MGGWGFYGGVGGQIEGKEVLLIGICTYICIYISKCGTQLNREQLNGIFA